MCPEKGLHSGPGALGPLEAKGLPGWPDPGKVPGAGVGPLLACRAESQQVCTVGVGRAPGPSPICTLCCFLFLDLRLAAVRELGPGEEGQSWPAQACLRHPSGTRSSGQGVGAVVCTGRFLRPRQAAMSPLPGPHSAHLPSGEHIWDPLPTRVPVGQSVCLTSPPAGPPPMTGHHYHFSMMWLM